MPIPEVKPRAIARHGPAVSAAVLVQPSGYLGIALAKTARRNDDPDADGEASLGHRDHVARVTRHSAFLIRSHPRSHGCSVLSSRLGLRLGEIMFDPCAVVFASPPMSARSSSSSRSHRIGRPQFRALLKLLA
jgi:hypothetical protein